MMTILIAFALLAGFQHPGMPAGTSHADHLKQMQKDADLKRRGALAMGFDQDTTVHHFTTTATGGTIAVAVRDAADAAGRSAIRAHLKEIADAFANGDFAKPLETHGELPPGVPAMQRLAGAIRYRYADTPRGGIVTIATKDPDALKAVHAFLEYQTREHHVSR